MGSQLTGGANLKGKNTYNQNYLLNTRNTIIHTETNKMREKTRVDTSPILHKVAETFPLLFFSIFSFLNYMYLDKSYICQIMPTM